MLLHAQHVVFLQIEPLLCDVRQLVSDFAKCAQTPVLEIGERRFHLHVLPLAMCQFVLLAVHHLFAQLVAGVGGERGSGSQIDTHLGVVGPAATLLIVRQDGGHGDLAVWTAR